MPSGTSKPREWVRVPQIKGPLMCSVCGQRELKHITGREKFVRFCGDTGKSCRVSALHCAGAFIREDKVKKVLKEWEMLYGTD